MLRRSLACRTASSSSSSSLYVTSRAGQTYRFLLQHQSSPPSSSSSSSSSSHPSSHQQLNTAPLLLEEASSAQSSTTSSENLSIQHLLFPSSRTLDDQYSSASHNSYSALSSYASSSSSFQGGDFLSRELAAILTGDEAVCATPFSTGRSPGWWRALSLLSSALSERRRHLLGTESSAPPPSSMSTGSAAKQQKVGTLHYNLALAICSKHTHWRAMQRCETSMAVNGVAADAHTLNLFMCASCASGDWANALELFGSTVSASDSGAQRKSMAHRAEENDRTSEESAPMFNPHSVKLALDAVAAAFSSNRSRSSLDAPSSSRHHHHHPHHHIGGNIIVSSSVAHVDGSHWNAALRIYGRFPRTIEQSAHSSTMLATVVQAAITRASSDANLLRTWDERWRSSSSSSGGSGAGVGNTILLSAPAAILARRMRSNNRDAAATALLDAQSIVHLSAAAERSDTWTVALELASGAVALGVSAPQAVLTSLVSAALRTACRTRKADSLTLDLLRSFLQQYRHYQWEEDDPNDEQEDVNKKNFFELQPSAVDAASTICARLGKYDDLTRVKHFAVDTLGYASSSVFTALLRLLENRFEYVVAQQRKQPQKDEERQHKSSPLFDPDVAVAQQRTVLHEFLSQCRRRSMSAAAAPLDKIASDSVAWLCLDSFRQMFDQVSEAGGGDLIPSSATTATSGATLWQQALARLATATRQPDAMVFAVALEIVRSAPSPSTVAALDVLEAAAAAAASSEARSGNSGGNNRKPFAVTIHDALEIFTSSTTAAASTSGDQHHQHHQRLGRATQLSIELGFQGSRQLQKAIAMLQLNWLRESKLQHNNVSASTENFPSPFSASMIPLLVRIDQKSTGAQASASEQQRLVLDIIAFVSSRSATSGRQQQQDGEKRMLAAFLLRRLFFADWSVEARGAAIALLTKSAMSIAVQLTESDLDWLVGATAAIERSCCGNNHDMNNSAVLFEQLFDASRLVALWGQNANPLFRLPDAVVAALLSAATAQAALLRQQPQSSITSAPARNSSPSDQLKSDNDGSAIVGLWQKAMSIFFAVQNVGNKHEVEEERETFPVLASSKLIQQPSSDGLLFQLVKLCVFAGDADTAGRLLCDKRRPARLGAGAVASFLIALAGDGKEKSNNRGGDNSASSALSHLMTKAAIFYSEEWPRRVHIKLLQSQWGAVQQQEQLEQQQRLLLAESRKHLMKRLQQPQHKRTQQQQPWTASAKTTAVTSQAAAAAATTATPMLTAATVSQLFVSHLNVAPETITVQSMLCVVRSLSSARCSLSSSSMMMQELQHVLSAVEAADVTGKLTGRAALAIAAEWNIFAVEEEGESRQTIMTVPIILEQLLRQALAEGLRVTDSVWRGAAAVALVRAGRRLAAGMRAGASCAAVSDFSKSLSLFLRLAAPVAHSNSSSSPDIFFAQLQDTLAAVSDFTVQTPRDDIAFVAFAMCRAAATSCVDIGSDSASDRKQREQQQQQQQQRKRNEDARQDLVSMLLCDDDGGRDLVAARQAKSAVVAKEFQHAALRFIVAALDDAALASAGQLEQSVGDDDDAETKNSSLKRLVLPCSGDTSAATVAAVADLLVEQAAGDESCKQRVATLLELLDAQSQADRTASAAADDHDAAILLPLQLFASKCTDAFLDDARLLASLAASIRRPGQQCSRVNSRAVSISVFIIRDVVEAVLSRMTESREQQQQGAAVAQEVQQARVQLFCACALFAFRADGAGESGVLQELAMKVPVTPLFANIDLATSGLDDGVSELCSELMTRAPSQLQQRLLRAGWRRAMDIRRRANGHDMPTTATTTSSLLEHVLESPPSSPTLSVQVGCQLLADALRMCCSTTTAAATGTVINNPAQLAEMTNRHLRVLLDIADADRHVAVSSKQSSSHGSNSNIGKSDRAFTDKKSKKRSIIASAVQSECVLIARLLDVKVAARAFDSLLKPALLLHDANSDSPSSSSSFSALLVAHAIVRQRAMNVATEQSAMLHVHQRAVEQLLPAALLLPSTSERRRRPLLSRARKTSVVVAGSDEDMQRIASDNKDADYSLLVSELLAWRLEQRHGDADCLAETPTSALRAAFAHCDVTNESKSSGSRLSAAVRAEMMRRLSGGGGATNDDGEEASELLILGLEVANSTRQLLDGNDLNSSEQSKLLFSSLFARLSNFLAHRASSAETSSSDVLTLFQKPFSAALNSLLRLLDSNSVHGSFAHIFLDPTPAQQAKFRRRNTDGAAAGGGNLVKVPVLVTTTAFRAAVRCASTLGCVEELSAICRHLRRVAASSSSHNRDEVSSICSKLELGVLLLHLPLACSIRLGKRRRTEQETDEEILTMCASVTTTRPTMPPPAPVLSVQQLLSHITAFIQMVQARRDVVQQSRLVDADLSSSSSPPSASLLHLQSFSEPLAAQLVAVAHATAAKLVIGNEHHRRPRQTVWFCLEGRMIQKASSAATTSPLPPPPVALKEVAAPTQHSVAATTSAPASSAPSVTSPAAAACALPALWRDALYHVQRLTQRLNHISTSSVKNSSPTAKDWDAAITQLGGMQRVDFLFAMRAPWNLASEALSRLVAAERWQNESSGATAWASEAFLCAVARAHMRNVAKSVQPKHIQSAVKARQARALAETLFLSQSSSNPDAATAATAAERQTRVIQRDPELLQHLLRAIAWSGNDAESDSAWSVCFKLYSIEQKQKQKQNVRKETAPPQQPVESASATPSNIESLVSLVFAVQRAHALSNTAKAAKLNAIGVEFRSRSKAAEFSAEDCSLFRNTMAKSPFVDVKLLDQILH